MLAFISHLRPWVRSMLKVGMYSSKKKSKKILQHDHLTVIRISPKTGLCKKISPSSSNILSLQ